MKEILISDITLSGLNPRSDEAYKDEEFQDLKTSIQENGFFLHHALLVRPLNGGYELITGHRRLAAVKELGIKKVPVTIHEYTDSEAKLILAADNFNRSDFKPMEEAAYLKKLLEGEDITQDELGKRLGKSQAYIANRLRLLAAPEELKEMVISREISPKHVIALLPYSGYPVFEEILSDLKEKLKHEGVVSVQGLNEIFVTNLDFHNSVLNLDDLPWTETQYRDFFDKIDDKTGCETCKDIVRIKGLGDKKERYCLNPDCWTPKLNEAHKSYELAEAKKVKNLGNKKVVDTTNLQYDQYKDLSDYWCKFDKTECSSCENCKKDHNKKLVCLDPECYTKKERAHKRAENKKAREEAEKVWAALEDMLTGTTDIGEGELRFVVLQLSTNIIWTAAVKKAYTPWKDLVKKGSELPAVKDIPAEDLPKLLMRLVIIQRMNGGNGLPTMDQFGRAVEGVTA